MLSSLTFQHLQPDLHIALREVLRGLRPCGSLHLMDFGGDSHHLHGLTRLARRSQTPQDNWDDRIRALMHQAGSEAVDGSSAGPRTAPAAAVA